MKAQRRTFKELLALLCLLLSYLNPTVHNQIEGVHGIMFLLCSCMYIASEGHCCHVTKYISISLSSIFNMTTLL